VASGRRASLKDDSTSWYSWILAATAQQPARNPAPIPDPTPANPKGAVPEVDASHEQANGEQQLKWLVEYFFKSYDVPVPLHYGNDKAGKTRSPYDVLRRYVIGVEITKLEEIKVDDDTNDDMYLVSNENGDLSYSSVLDDFGTIFNRSEPTAPSLRTKSGISLKEESNRVKWNALIAKLLQLRKACFTKYHFSDAVKFTIGSVIFEYLNKNFYGALLPPIKNRIHDYIADAFNSDNGDISKRCGKIYDLVGKFNFMDPRQGDIHRMDDGLAFFAMNAFFSSFHNLPIGADGKFDFSTFRPGWSGLRKMLIDCGGTGKQFFEQFSFTALDAKFNDVKIDGDGEDSQKLCEAIAQMEAILDSAIASVTNDLRSWTGFNDGNMTLLEWCNNLAQQWRLGNSYVEEFKMECESKLGRNYPGVSDLETNGDCMVFSLKLRDEARKALQEPIKF
jgi:hypothetical protein